MAPNQRNDFRMHGVKFEHSFKSLQIWLDTYNKTVQVHEVFPDRLSAQIKIRDGTGILIGPLVERLDNRPIVLSNQFTNYSSNNDDYADMPPLTRVSDIDRDSDSDIDRNNDSDNDDIDYLPPLEDDNDDDIPQLIPRSQFSIGNMSDPFESSIITHVYQRTVQEYQRTHTTPVHIRSTDYFSHVQPFQHHTNIPQPTGTHTYNAPSMGDTYLFDNYDE